MFGRDRRKETLNIAVCGVILRGAAKGIIRFIPHGHGYMFAKHDKNDNHNNNNYIILL
jgi:hypothetical protein